ncbi:oligosaccharide flippase family protein [Sporofaciens musculi]|uniref:oligosaccharide flippase family protein n=1 Tax=Sporofaciens musculi TaxID=2681861 RepID=UPI0025A02210|nr:oligosaccharide flippase family protein [Sporofaciens musculi]
MKNNKVIKAGIGYTICNYMLKGLAFFTVPIFSRILSTGDYGIYNTFAAYESVMFVLIGCTLQTSYKNARYKYDTDDTFDSYVSSTMLLTIFSMLFWNIMFYLFRNQISEFLSIPWELLCALILYSFSTAIIGCFNVYISLDYRYKTFLAISLCNSIGNILLSILMILYVFPEEGYMGRVLGTTIPAAVIALYILLRQFKIANPKINLEFWKWGLSYSLPVMPHTIGQVILSQFDRIMILKMVNAQKAGIYSFAYNIYSIVYITSTSLDHVWSPWFYREMHKGNENGIQRYTTMYSYGMLLFSSCVMLGSVEIVKLLGPKEYGESVLCVVPLVAGGFFTFLHMIPIAVEYYYEKTKFIALCTVSAALINVLLNWIFINRLGYVAASYTTFVTYFLYFMFHYLLSIKIHKKPFISGRTVIIETSAILIMMALALVLADKWHIRWGMIIVICMVCMFVGYRYLSSVRKGFD